MNILVIGSGGREHALCYGLKKSPQLKDLYCLPGNTGIAGVAECVGIKQNDFPAIAEFCKAKDISLVVVGPEAPLVEGITDYLEAKNIKVFGPRKNAARLEASKDFTKSICKKYNIPTALYESFSNADEARGYIKKHGAPIVVKADGLAAGKGVVVAMTEDEAIEAVEEMLVSKRFGEASQKIVIEEFLEGQEVSFFAICDGERAIPFGTACDHKRVGDDDTGPNTGGMGTYSPANNFDDELAKKVMREIIEPTIAAMKKEAAPFKGFLFAGLILTKQGPKLLEYNVRMGDPETQSIIPRIENDLVDVLLGRALPEFSDQSAVTVVMAASGYPGDYVKNTEIKNLDKITEAIVFHAGTTISDGKILATGGRVLGITALGADIGEARNKAYKEIAKINWPQGFCRKDIGKKAA